MILAHVRGQTVFGFECFPAVGTKSDTGTEVVSLKVLSHISDMSCHLSAHETVPPSASNSSRVALHELLKLFLAYNNTYTLSVIRHPG